MKRPLALVALLYGGGLLLAETWQPPLVVLFASAFALSLAAIFLGRLRFFLVLPLIVMVGWTNLICRTIFLSPQDLRIQLTATPEDLRARGTLCETPTRKLYVHDEQDSWRTLARLEVIALRRGTDWQVTHGKIVVVTQGTLPPEFFSGQQVEVAGIIAPPPTALAEGLFDYRAYLKRQGIYFQLKADSPADWHLLSTNQMPPLSDRFREWAQRTIATGLPDQDEPLKLLWAMTLGWRANITDEVYEPFMQSGTMHIFAISGLHIALIAGILVALLRVAQVPRFWCGLVIIPILWFYTGVTGWQPSAIRSTIMMSIIIGGWALKRPSNLLNSLAAAAFVILLYDPQQLFQASFQLSFFVVLSIALVMPPLERLRDRLLQTDPLLPRELIPPWKRRLSVPLRIVMTWLATSFAAWLGSWPLVAYYFHIFSPVTLLANLLIVPLAGLALSCNLGSLICGSWFPSATELFNHSGWFWMKLMMDISHTAIQLPHAFFYVASPTLVDFGIYYAALILVLSGVAFRRRWRIPTALAIVAVVIFYGWQWQSARKTTVLTVLPLSGGSAIYVHSGTRAKDLLIDCGDENPVEFVTKPFLHAHGVNHLPLLALTHGDLRDIGGALSVCDSFSIQHVVTSPVRFRSATYRRIIETLDETADRRVIVTQGDSIDQWQILYPSATNNFPQADDNSLVLMGEIHGVRVLLLSDLGRPGQRALLETTNDLRADIVVTGLPEKSEPLSDTLLNAIQPQFIIVADSEFPATERASSILQERLAQQNLPVIYTRDTGAVKIIVNGKGWVITTMNGDKFTGVPRR